MNDNTVQPQGPFSRFKLVRATDITGISGTGVIAVGVQWPDQTCHLIPGSRLKQVEAIRVRSNSNKSTATMMLLDNLMHVLNGWINMNWPLALVIIVLIICATVIIWKWLETP